MKGLHTEQYHTLRKQLCSGDFLLCSGQSVFSKLIQAATQSMWSHVAFILRVDAIERIIVLESVESIGVRAIPLSNYVRDYNGTGSGYPGTLMIARHHHMNPKHVTQFSKNAVDLLGYPYSKEDIIKIAARLSLHALGSEQLFDTPHAHPNHPRAFICSEYVAHCLEKIGIHIPKQHASFITPHDFSICKDITPIAYLHSEQHRGEGAMTTPVHVHSN